jgi:cytochrome b
MNKEDSVKVWDILVRLFHWSLLLAFVIAYLSAEEWESVHVYSGYTVLGLIVFRVFWGLVGSKYARFSEFVYPSKVVVQYLNEMIEEHPKRYLGHNPAGGWMIMALLLSLFVVTVSGLKVYAVEEVLGLSDKDVFKAYPFIELNKLNDKSFTDSVNGKIFTVHWNGDAQSGYITDDSGIVVPTVQSYWFAFHPETLVFTGQ